MDFNFALGISYSFVFNVLPFNSVQMLAFSLLDAIIAVDWQQRWLNYLSIKGYLRHMTEALPHEDHILQSMLDPSPEPLKVMFILSSLVMDSFNLSAS